MDKKIEEEFGHDDSTLFYAGIFLFLLFCVVMGFLWIYSKTHLEN